MSIEIKCVIGASFGDEGKGLMTDYFCKELLDKGHKRVLNIRYNGGHQASHTVCTSDKKRHIFNGIGAGSFNSCVDTYFGPEFLINLFKLDSELEERKEFNDLQIYGDDKCRLVLPFDIYLNVMREKHRGVKRHGTCQNGIFECIKRNEADFELRLQDLYEGRSTIKKKIVAIRDEYFIKELKDLDEEVDNIECFEDNWIEGLLDNMCSIKSRIIKVTNRKDLLNSYSGIVFEGAQGLMLDKDNVEYMPHLTPSSTGLPYIMNLVSLVEEPKLEVCYVTRSYNTRHGAGRLDGEVEKKVLGAKIAEYTNNTNIGQGIFRFGYIQLDDIGRHIAKDIENLKGTEADISICVTHLDQTDGFLIKSNEKVAIESFDFCDLINKYAKIKLGFVRSYTSYGETRENISVLN